MRLFDILAPVFQGNVSKQQQMGDKQQLIISWTIFCCVFGYILCKMLNMLLLDISKETTFRRLLERKKRYQQGSKIKSGD